MYIKGKTEFRIFKFERFSLRMSWGCFGVSNKMNSSKNIFDARRNDGAAMVEKSKSEWDLGGFECDVSDEVLVSIDESVFVKEECRVSDGNVNCVVKHVFNHCTITFNYGKSSIYLLCVWILLPEESQELTDVLW